MLKVLLIGKDGQVGFELQRSLSPIADLISLGREECDLTDHAMIHSAVAAIRPNVIVNAAAYTAVDNAESNKHIAFAVNGIAPGILAEEAKAIDALFVHFSTDYVFDGLKTASYTENDFTNPVNTYGQSKLLGETATRSSNVDHLILRTSWVFGTHGNNFVKSILRLATTRDSLSVVSDQFGAPTSAALIADTVAKMINRYGESNRSDFPHGTFHLTATGETHWQQFAQVIVQTAGQLGLELRLNPDAIFPISTSKYGAPAARPSNSRLNTDKIKQHFDVKLPDWTDGLLQVLQQLVRK